MVDFRKPERWDALVLARNLRQRDRDEVEASVGSDIVGAIRTAMVASGDMCWAVDGGQGWARLAWIIGCAPVADGVGSPWLLATDLADETPGALTKLTKVHIRLMLERYPLLVNYVDARNTASVRWLARLGFRVEEPVPFGLKGLPFHRFTMGA